MKANSACRKGFLEKGQPRFTRGSAQELGWSVGGWGAPVAITTSAHQFRPDTNHRSYANN